MLPLAAAVELSVLPGALGATLLKTFVARSPAQPLGSFRLDVALADACPGHEPAAMAARARAAAAPLLDDLAAGRRRVLVFGGPGYPSRLAAIPDPPPLLWINGDGALAARPVIAVVGSRYAAPSSLEVAFVLARDLAAAGVVVVSGLARGVDEAAHRGALEAGTTIAVLGCGIDQTYPPEHAALAEVIAASGAIVSELPPSAPPRPDHFPRRNRIISGLSLGVVVVEASLKSGSLITARCAADQGREVMAVPGTALGVRHKGSHSLIRDGAALVETAEDILAALGVPVSTGASVDEAVEADPILAALAGGDAVTLEALGAATGLAAGELLGRLSMHEIAGHVTKVPGGAFRAVRTAVVR